MTSGFLVIAGLLALGAALIVAWPLWRATARARFAAAASAVTVLATSALLYPTWSNWSWTAAEHSADSPQMMVARLARRLEGEPGDLAGWLMLGRSYTVLEQYSLAARAFSRADRLAGGVNVEALTGWAEALLLENREELRGRAGRLFERALDLDPKDGKALFYSAFAALDRGEPQLARERFAALLALDPPANVRPILEQQIAALDNAAAATAGPQVKVRVRVASALLERVPQNAPLFVFVRRIGAAGPPLAAKRLDARFPQEVRLTTADSMIAGVGFADQEQVEVVARIARSGSPTAQSGDLVGRVRYQIGRDGLEDIEINSVTP